MLAPAVGGDGFEIRFLLVGTFFGDVSSDFNSGFISPSNDGRDNFYVKKVFYPDDHGFLFSSRVMVYRTACRYEYDVTLMSMTSSPFDFRGRLQL